MTCFWERRPSLVAASRAASFWVSHARLLAASLVALLCHLHLMLPLRPNVPISPCSLCACSHVLPEDGTQLLAPAVVLTTGTFLRGEIHIGPSRGCSPVTTHMLRGFRPLILMDAIRLLQD